MREVLLPASPDELWRCLEDLPQAVVYAGGTDLLVKMYHGLSNPRALICIERIQELRGVSEQGGHIRIGSCTTHAHLIADPLVQAHLSVLGQAVKQLGSPPIRNMGTIGGNICTASPAGDTLPPLYALEAEVEIQSKGNMQRIQIEEFILGPGAVNLQPGEILAAVWIKKPDEYNLHHFEKVGLRNALACSVVNMAALLGFGSDGIVRKASLAWGSVGPTIATCREAEEALTGEKLTPEGLREAAAIVRKTVNPITDVRADAEYRRTVAGNLLLRLQNGWKKW
jgi:xanthine dehydrogenase FAD-binding subunit